MATRHLGTNVTLPATPPVYYIGVTSDGTTPHIAQNLNVDVFGASIPASLTSFQFNFNTTSTPSNTSCTLLFLWSFDGGTTYIQVPPAGSVTFAGGTYTNKSGTVTGSKRVGPFPIQQSPYPDHFIMQVSDCPSSMGPIDDVSVTVL